MFNAYSVWLFTRSDLKTIVIPSALFGILNSVALALDTNNGFVFPWPQALMRLPLVFLWLWINLLPFNIDNQRQAKAILEDKLNKPWRAMPSCRMTPAEATALMFCLYPIALCTSLWIGGVRQCLALMLLGFSYNELGLADRSWSSRNAINALGFCCFTSGALEVSLSMRLQFMSPEFSHMSKWFGVIAAVVFSTVQTQDMADQEGDHLRKRKTMPLTLGDGTTRWLISMFMVLWSVFCPRFWALNIGLSFIFGGLGTCVAYRTLAFRNVEADRRTFVIWTVWMAVLYSLPLLAAVSH